MDSRIIVSSGSVNRDVSENAPLLIIENSGFVGIGMSEERREAAIADNWTHVSIRGVDYGRRAARQEGDTMIIEYEKRVWREHLSARVLRLIMGGFRAIGWGRWADEVEAGGEDGSTYGRLGESVATGGVYEIARAPVKECQFLHITSRFVAPSQRLYVTDSKAEHEPEV